MNGADVYEILIYTDDQHMEYANIAQVMVSYIFDISFKPTI